MIDAFLVRRIGWFILAIADAIVVLAKLFGYIFGRGIRRA